MCVDVYTGKAKLHSDAGKRLFCLGGVGWDEASLLSVTIADQSVICSPLKAGVKLVAEGQRRRQCFLVKWMIVDLSCYHSQVRSVFEAHTCENGIRFPVESCGAVLLSYYCWARALCIS